MWCSITGKTNSKLWKGDLIMETLVMPLNAVELHEDEMEYLDGGLG